MYTQKKLDTRLLGDQIEDELMHYILETPIEVGNKLPNEFELGEMFGVGRSTIREAVKSLVSKGVLESHSNSFSLVMLPTAHLTVYPWLMPRASKPS